SNPATVTSEVWALSLDGNLAWTSLPATDPPPSQYQASALYDGLRRSLVVFAGIDSFGVIQPPQELSLDVLSWHPLTSNRPRLGPVGFGPIFDPLRSRYLVSASDTLWVTTLGGALVWSPLLARDPNLIETQRSSAAVDVSHDRLV